MVRREVRHEWRGDGITAYKIKVIDDDSLTDLEKFCGPDGFFTQFNDALQRNNQSFFKMETEWVRAVCANTLRDHPDWLQGRFAAQSPKAYAQKILRWLTVAEKYERQGNIDQAMRYAFLVGLEWQEAAMKFRWQDDAQRGEKVAGGARNAAHATNAQHREPRERRFARMAELIPHHGVYGAARICEDEGFGKARTIHRQWYRHHKKL